MINLNNIKAKRILRLKTLILGCVNKIKLFVVAVLALLNAKENLLFVFK